MNGRALFSDENLQPFKRKMHSILASSYNVGVTVLMATSLRPNTKTSLSDTKHYRSFFIMTVGQR